MSTDRGRRRRAELLSMSTDRGRRRRLELLTMTTDDGEYCGGLRVWRGGSDLLGVCLGYHVARPP